MKKVLLIAALLASVGEAQASKNQSYKLITASTYLNFFLLNLNACEDFHPSTRKEAYAAEAKLYPFLYKLDKKVAQLDIDENDKAAVSNTVSDRRIKLNEQIAEGEFTVEHCKAVISIVNEGLDFEVLKNVE